MRYVVMALICCATLANAMDIETLLMQARSYHEGKLSKIDDMTLEYTGTFNAPSGENGGIQSTMIRKGELWRMDATIGMGSGEASVNGETKKLDNMSMETTVLYDGKDVWTSVMGMKMKVPKEQAMEQISFTQYWNEPPAGSTVLGEETVNGRACYVIEHPKNEFIEHPTKMWIDKEYFVNVQSEAYASGKLIKSVFGDFKAIEGEYVIPHTASVTSDGAKTFDMVITKIEVNKGVDASMFDSAKLGGGAMDLDLQKMMKQAEEMQKKAEEMQKKQSQGK